MEPIDAIRNLIDNHAAPGMTIIAVAPEVAADLPRFIDGYRVRSVAGLSPSNAYLMTQQHYFDLIDQLDHLRPHKGTVR